MRETSELPNAVPPWASLLRSVLGGVFPFRRSGVQARQRSWATTLFRNSRRHCCSAGVDAIGFGANKHRRGRCAAGEIGTGFGEGISTASASRFPPRTYPRRRATSDVRQPIKRSRRSCRVARAPYEETNRSRRKICAMRHFSRVAIDNSPTELT